MIPIHKKEGVPSYLDRIVSGRRRVQGETTAAVGEIIESVRREGDSALIELAERFGNPVYPGFRVPREAIGRAEATLDEATRAVLEQAYESIRSFAEQLMNTLTPVESKREDYTLGMRFAPVESVGCYVPGGRYPLPSTALMTTVPAAAAGVERICIACPDPRPEVLYAASLSGVSEVYCLGGAQAIAALALGTNSFAPVDMIVGPGNAFVTEAKRQLQGAVGIDMLAGPSEVAIIADGSANPELVAAELLAQAEHDPRAGVWLLTDSAGLAQAVRSAVEEMTGKLALPDFVEESLAAGAILLVENLDACVEISDRLAPEHLQVQVASPRRVTERLKHFGSLFIGAGATVPFGDYAAGQNHTLPTGGCARFSSGLSPLSFLRTQTWMRVDGSVGELASTTAAFADLEGLKAHAHAARLRGRAQES